ncbi:thioesterase domain-containing protein [Saccharothrix texasensis]|uniref:Thioesterase domain-containing protein n=1 Tax=Saccharothrix texasensis TaxID=103734 RepID=A0A3N1GYB1_9PSEU|nr:thioesterase domain-containing protein [Saccharothrix texasensis]ROP35012.1 thioesterase domain-containing protein [Saccharothrix texasensis]
MNPTVDDVLDTGYRHPRDPVELWLARQWQEVIGFAVGIRENFFELGGNSLDAARVVNAVLEELGVQLPLNVMTEHPTVESLAARLREHNARLSDPLVLIQRGDGAAPPLFLVHPANGQVGPYAGLAQELGEDFTVFGLQAAGLYADVDPVASVRDMARTYVEAVRAAWPTGPYLLGGCDTGASIAHEMAARLTEDGAEVRLLALVDAGLLDLGPRFDQPPGDLDAVLDRWKELDLVPPDATPEFARRSARVWQANEDAVHDWEPRPYPGPVDVFLSPSGDRPVFADWPSAVTREHTPQDGDVAGPLRGLIG